MLFSFLPLSSALWLKKPHFHKDSNTSISLYPIKVLGRNILSITLLGIFILYLSTFVSTNIYLCFPTFTMSPSLIFYHGFILTYYFGKVNRLNKLSDRDYLVIKRLAKLAVQKQIYSRLAELAKH